MLNLGLESSMIRANNITQAKNNNNQLKQVIDN